VKKIVIFFFIALISFVLLAEERQPARVERVKVLSSSSATGVLLIVSFAEPSGLKSLIGNHPWLFHLNYPFNRVLLNGEAMSLLPLKEGHKL